MARGLVLVVLAVVGSVFSVFGQESAQTLRSFGVGWMVLDLAQLNEALQTQGYPALAAALFLWGGGNTALPSGVLGEYSLAVSNWYGSASAQRDDKLTRFTLTWFGGIAEQPLPQIALMRWELRAGLAVGVGVANLTVLDHRPTNFSEALRSPAAAFFTRWFFTVSPQLSASFPVITFEKSHALLLTLSAGYTLTFDNGAWDQEGRALKGPPANFNGWIVQLSVGL
ncbi:MAG: hypothetical protein ACK4HB_04815 [Candidatus Bipolaricaulia bacterium]